LFDVRGLKPKENNGGLPFFDGAAPNIETDIPPLMKRMRKVRKKEKYILFSTIKLHGGGGGQICANGMPQYGVRTGKTRELKGARRSSCRLHWNTVQTYSCVILYHGMSELSTLFLSFFHYFLHYFRPFSTGRYGRIRRGAQITAGVKPAAPLRGIPVLTAAQKSTAAKARSR
jgi:hypothetical protein